MNVRDQHFKGSGGGRSLKDRVEGEAGCILLDRQRRIGWAYNSQDMAMAYMTEALPQPAVFTRKESRLAIV